MCLNFHAALALPTSPIIKLLNWQSDIWWQVLCIFKVTDELIEKAAQSYSLLLVLI